MGCPVEVAPSIGRPISKVVSIISGAKGFMVVWGRIQKHIRICFRMNSAFRGRCLTDEQKRKKLARRSRCSWCEWRTIAIWRAAVSRSRGLWIGNVQSVAAQIPRVGKGSVPSRYWASVKTRDRLLARPVNLRRPLSAWGSPKWNSAVARILSGSHASLACTVRYPQKK